MCSSFSLPLPGNGSHDLQHLNAPLLVAGARARLHPKGGASFFPWHPGGLLLRLCDRLHH